MKSWQKLEKEKFKNMLHTSKKHGSPKSSSHNPTSKNDGDGSNKVADESFSPYKNVLGQIKRFSLNNDGEDDFKSPKPVKSIPKMFKLQQPPKKGTSKKITRKKSANSVLKRTKDNFKNLDINPEHLQMALALSKSTFAQEFPEKLEETREEDLPSFLSAPQIPKVTTFLEKYGFKSNKNQLYPEFSKDYLSESKKRKNSKFRFVTPTLYTRTAEERESLLNSKVSLILSQQNLSKSPRNVDNAEETNSAVLNIYLSAKICWDKNNEVHCTRFILPALQLSPPKATVGCLLKNWEEIPGREKSPQRFKDKENVEIEQTEKSTSCQIDKTSTSNETSKNISLLSDNTISEYKRTRMCSSPDLFCSDDESFQMKSPCHRIPCKGLESSLNNLNEDIERIIKKKSFTVETDLLTSSKMSETDKEFKEMEVEDYLLSISSSSTTESFSSPVNEIIDLEAPETSLKFTTKTSADQNVKIDEGRSFKKSKSLSSSFTSEEEINDSLVKKSADQIKSKRKTKNVSPNASNKISFNTLFNKRNEKYSVPDSSRNNSNNSDVEIDKASKNISNYFNSNKQVQSVQISSSKSDSELSSELSKRLSCSSSNSSLEVLEENDKGIEFFESFYDVGDQFDGRNVKTDTFVDLTLSSDEDEMPNSTSEPFRTVPIENKGIDNKGIENEKEFSENITPEIEENVNLSSNIRYSLTAKRLSMDSENISLHYNHTKSLNVTDYVMEVLNSQEEIGENEEDALPSEISCSQESIEIISDEELNYSSRFSAQNKNMNFYDLDNFDDCIEINLKNEDIDSVHSNLKNKYKLDKIDTENEKQIGDTNNDGINADEDNDCENPEKSSNCTVIDRIPSFVDIETKNPKPSTSTQNEDESSVNTVEQNLKPSTSTQNDKDEDLVHTVDKNPKPSTPIQTNKNDIQRTFNVNTPSNNLIIKTSNITPMADYEEMDTPKIRSELDKFGIKPLKRRRGVELLKYIYESTHPIVDGDDVGDSHAEEEERRTVKKRKLNAVFECTGMDGIEIVGTKLIEREKESDLLFERKTSKKIMSCRIPLQIAWWNFLCCNQTLKENILMYEPIQIEVIHSMFKEQSGFNFHIEDLVTFLDKKCITFRTNKWHKRNQKLKQDKTKS